MKSLKIVRTSNSRGSAQLARRYANWSGCLAFLVVSLVFLGCGTPPSSEVLAKQMPRLPLLCIQAEASEPLQEFLTDPVNRQPWVAGNCALPETLADLGLNEPIRLVWTEVYFDGGSRGFLLEDSSGMFFACSTTPLTEPNPAFYLGTIGRDVGGFRRAELGTPAFRFLFNLVWSFADRPEYKCAPDILRKMQESAGISDEEMAEFLKKPDDFH